MSESFEVGTKLAELIRQKKYLEAVDSLYSPNIVSIEAQSFRDMPTRLEGIKAIRGKNEWWVQNHDIHSSQVSGPFPHGDRFILLMKADATCKDGPMAGQRMTMEESALYTVKNGKIVHEEFFYHMPT